MSLQKFYELRENFIVLGLTGKMQAGADEVVKTLNNTYLCDDKKRKLKIFTEKYQKVSNSEAAKYRRLSDFYAVDENWREFKVIEYKNVILLFILQHNFDTNKEKFAENLTDWILEIKNFDGNKSARFGFEIGLGEGSEEFISTKYQTQIKTALNNLKHEELAFLQDENWVKQLGEGTENFFFSASFQEFSKSFFDFLDEFSVYLRHKMIHHTTYCLRKYGTVDVSKIIAYTSDENPFTNIYIVAEVINKIIKGWRRFNSNNAHVIIDRLKNSYELNYFREKYAGFYTVATHRAEKERCKSIYDKLKNHYQSTERSSTISENYNEIIAFDKVEYQTNDFSEGKFESFDIENCVQKADYHIYYDDELSDFSIYDKLEKDNEFLLYGDEKLAKTNRFYIYQPLLIQILKLTALIKQPGLITPSYPERIMQVAFNTKLNSGCISRQVGAVVTDSSFSIKGVGWNEVPHGQTPCSSRDIRDFKTATEEDNKGFTPFELSKESETYKDSKTFQQKLIDDIDKIGDYESKLKGRPCSFCFKSHHNAYEAKANQVHTRALHAEENAMLQISKYGGQPLKGGNLFSTASPCELCAKKAYQLGIKNIFYIDLYPGISITHILETGNNVPNVFAFQGAIGRGFNKLYEPLMAQKDELLIRVGFKPTVSKKEQAAQIQNIIKSKVTNELKEHLDTLKDDPDIIGHLVRLMEKGLQKE